MQPDPLPIPTATGNIEECENAPSYTGKAFVVVFPQINSGSSTSSPMELHIVNPGTYTNVATYHVYAPHNTAALNIRNKVLATGATEKVSICINVKP